ncbi:MAG: glycosyltransferase family 2 protein [Candidatus Magasanikbacteria bacterium]|nr:glycosyltransferase family 2 protein [Candidatus Magasanikbacteria bacterium]
MIVALLPAYNEEHRVRGVVESLLPLLDRVVVIDDASEDCTAREADRAGAFVLRHKINRGQGAALQTGHEYAKKIGAEYALHFDADGQFDPADIPGALAYIRKQRADVLFGSRFLKESSCQIPWLKRNILLPLAKHIDRLSGAVPLSDSHNGFRILSEKALGRIIISQDRMAHATEIPVLVRRYNLSYVEYPVHVHYKEYGQGFGSGFEILKDLILGRFV